MMKMLRASYDKKQDKLKQETNARLDKFRQEIEGIEANKYKKLKEIKKNVHRMRSKQAKSKGGRK